MKRLVNQEASLIMDQRKQRYQRENFTKICFRHGYKCEECSPSTAVIYPFKIAWPGVGGYDNDRTTEFSGNCVKYGLEWSQAAHQSYWRLRGRKCYEKHCEFEPSRDQVHRMMYYDTMKWLGRSDPWNAVPLCTYTHNAPGYRDIVNSVFTEGSSGIEETPP